MIDLLADDGRSGFGIGTALEIAGVPYRRIGRAEDFAARALVLTAPATAAAAALARRVPTLAFGAAGAPNGVGAGTQSGRTVQSAVTFPLGGPGWSEATVACANRFGKDALRLPWAPVFMPATPPSGTVVARMRDRTGIARAAVVRRGRTLWSLVDLGAALTSLLDESYATWDTEPATGRWGVLAQRLYYRLPEPMRRVLRRRVYARLRAAGDRCACPSDYPVDATGWLLVELVTSLVRSVAGPLVRLARWPAGHEAAAALTHDLEPTRFAYREGLAKLGAGIARTGHPPTFGVVVRAAGRHLTSTGLARLRSADVLCHGLEHLGETLAGSPAEIADRLAEGRAQLELALGRRIEGFRSPRLDRSPELLRGLDRVAFGYDSSYPDVDRETLSRYGGGVRLNVPFRPPIDVEPGRVRASNCLELPVAAPDCIQPLFAGESDDALRAAVTEKIAYVRATGGVYVGIVHAGVFGRADAARRGAHLDFVCATLRDRTVWLATATEIADWWRARERLRVRVAERVIEVTNDGERTVAGARIVVERSGEAGLALPPIAPGTAVRIALGHGGVAGAAATS